MPEPEPDARARALTLTPLGVAWADAAAQDMRRRSFHPVTPPRKPQKLPATPLLDEVRGDRALYVRALSSPADSPRTVLMKKDFLEGIETPA